MISMPWWTDFIYLPFFDTYIQIAVKSFYTASSSVTSGLVRSNRLVLEPSTSGYGGLGSSSSERVPLREMASAATNTSYQLVLVPLWMCLGEARSRMEEC